MLLKKGEMNKAKKEKEGLRRPVNDIFPELHRNKDAFSIGERI